MAKFYGEKEIKEIKDTTNEKLQQIIFTDDTSKIMPKIMIAAAVSDTALNPTELRNKRCFPVTKALLELYLEWDIHISEIDFISQRVIMSVNESLKKADEVLWKKSREEQTMSDVNNVITSAPTDAVPSPYVGQ